jgi:type IV pilus assembly protein PilX
MLKRRTPLSRLGRARQRGMVLLVALVVLVAITVAGIAMMRSVDTATLVTGNLAFQQAATHAADKGVEQAIAMLRQKVIDGTLDSNDTTNGYFASLRATDNPNTAANQNWQQFWQDSLKDSAYDAGEDQFKNQIFFVVHRQCANAMPPGAGGQCVASPAVTTATGNSQEANEVQLQSASQIYFRITVRVSGPRRTESYVQTYVAM